ncbi:MAG TPA: biotin--[acetyl-CoA-carboxylase] ligase [Kofleriaceae bacterium]|jgi:BirA family biotin operon repressor/biotin-[acetyl-CoA-carboxylase] ligase
MTGWLGAERHDLDECGSTNDEAARLARAGASHGAIVLALAQSAGRGREGRAWQSPPGAGLYLSCVLRPPLALPAVPPLTLALGIAVCDAARAFGAPAAIKWPNDILVPGKGPGKKLAGVLVEAQSQGARLEAVIAGIGVNLRGPVALDTAIALDEAADRPAPREAFLVELLARCETWIDRYVAGGIAAIAPAWRERMARGIRARATVGGAAVVGELAGLADDGALLLRAADGAVHAVRSGDVELVK